MKSKFGFTLVEIMIVVAIVSLLAVLALPVRAVPLTTINEASFNNVEKLAPALNTNFSNLNAAASGKVTNVVQTVQTASVIGSNGTFLVVTNVTLTIQR